MLSTSTDIQISMGKLWVRFSGPLLKKIPAENERLWTIPIGIWIPQILFHQVQGYHILMAISIQQLDGTPPFHFIDLPQNACPRIIHSPNGFCQSWARRSSYLLFCAASSHLTCPRNPIPLQSGLCNNNHSDGSTQSKSIMADFPVVMVACVTRLGR